jgi:hypothetical protein
MVAAASVYRITAVNRFPGAFYRAAALFTSWAARENNMNQQIQSLTIWQTLGLHLVPGALIAAFCFLTASLVMKAGYPALMALLLAVLVILIPFELGYLLYQGLKRTGRLSLNSVVLN